MEHYDGTRIDAYFECSASVSRSFNWGRNTVEARFDVLNILDRQYEVVRLYPMPGRSYMLTLKYKL